jgi:predicted O-linked N-acetylglucosamine transferase (SPINDLY family)
VVVPKQEDYAAIRRILDSDINWTLFARKAANHGLAGLAGNTLARVAPGLMPDDVLEALGLNIQRTRTRNGVLFGECARIIETLAKNGIEAIPFRGPVLALQAYGDFGLREPSDLDLLIRERDLASAVAMLGRLGYLRQEDLSVAQLDLTHRIQGREILIQKAAEFTIGVNTRLTPMNMALGIDYVGLWARAGRITLIGQSIPALAPEDELIALAIYGSKELWWNIKTACDFAVFITSHPRLDWTAVAARATAQGCRRMVLLATALAHGCFDVVVPESIVATEQTDPIIAPMVGRIMAHWQADKPIVPPSNKTLSMDRRQLHDGVARQGQYIFRALFSPGPYHVARIRLPGRLSFAYVPIKIADDFVATPLLRIYRKMRAQRGRLRQLLRAAAFARGAAPAEVEQGDRPPQKATEDMNPVLAAHPIANTEEASTWVNHARSLEAAGRFAEAVEASDRALDLDPANLNAMDIGVRLRIESCDWRRREDDRRWLTDCSAQLLSQVLRSCIDDSRVEGLALERLRARGYPQRPQPLWQGEHYSHDKVRIAYISGVDFQDPTGWSIVEVFEHHDRARFETTGISLGPHKTSAFHRRIEGAFDCFIDAQTMSNSKVAATLRELEIDIAIDLSGYSSEGARSIRVLASRPAPVQANFPSNCGTMGASFIDYIIADRIVIPEAHRMHFFEKVVYLPHSFLPNDRKRPIGDTPSRIEAGLPNTAFVFASFNLTYKITPEMFDIWMRLLRGVENSVLWLVERNTSACLNLRREVRARGVDPDRLIFTPPMSPARYMARLRLADLFLDTLPHNAGATASDALWVGLPLLTCVGNSFAGRTAASALKATGLPELVTNSLTDYEQLARTLARNPPQLAAIRTKLQQHRDTAPFFDAARYTHYLETAYTTMWERSESGLPPAGFAVEAA